MYTSIQLLDMVKARYSLPSDYAAAKLIGCTRGTISNIRVKRYQFGVDHCVKIAELLELDPMKVIGSMRIHTLQNQHDEKHIEMWQRYA